MKNSKYAITLILILCACCIMVAQGSAPGFNDAGGEGETVNDVAPIPGIIAAAVVGLYIGARKMYNNRNK